MLCYIPKKVSSSVISQYRVLAVAAVDGHATTDQMTEEALANPIYNQAVAKVRRTCPPSDNHSINQPLFSHIDSLKIHMKDGKVFSGDRQYLIGLLWNV